MCGIWSVQAPIDEGDGIEKPAEKLMLHILTSNLHFLSQSVWQRRIYYLKQLERTIVDFQYVNILTSYSQA